MNGSEFSTTRRNLFENYYHKRTVFFKFMEILVSGQTINKGHKEEGN